jgi:hypothetical protein
MKFELTLDASEIRVAIEEAEEKGVEDLKIKLLGDIDKNGNIIVTRKYIFGDCITEYSKSI